jgi:hypothetical protein
MNRTKRREGGGTKEKRDEARAAWFIRAKTTLYANARASLRLKPSRLVNILMVRPLMLTCVQPESSPLNAQAL